MRQAMVDITREELRKVLEAAKAANERDWLALLVGYCHALRVSEICGLTDKNIQNGFLSVNRLKGSERTVQPLCASPDPLFDEATALPRYAAAHAGRLFPVCRQHLHRLFVQYATEAGLPVPSRHVHVLKHARARHGLQGGVSLPDIQRYLGHKSLSSTGAYLKRTDAQAAQAFASAGI